MEINSFCKLALSIIDAVTFIHSHKLFHGFLSPLHIIWDLKDDVRLIDLSMCSQLVKDSGGAIQTKFDKVLAFVSPEQSKLIISWCANTE
jgi:serine/threonine protein kinase